MPVVSKMRRSAAGVAALGACGFASNAFVAPTYSQNMMRTTAEKSSHVNGMVQQGAGPTDSTLSHTLIGGAVGSLVVLSHLCTSRGFTFVGRSSGARVQTTTLSRYAYDATSQLGAMPPLGFFDPFGFSNGDEANFRNLRAAEIKHGRVAMMAAVGAVAQHYLKFPGFENVPAGLGAVTSPPGTYGFAALFLVAGALELGVWTESPDKEPGNFGDPLGLNQYDAGMRSREINNGRMAMFAILGIISAELLTGKDAIDQLAL